MVMSPPGAAQTLWAAGDGTLEDARAWAEPAAADAHGDGPARRAGWGRESAPAVFCTHVGTVL